MAVETQAPPQPTHDQEPTTRDRLYIGGEWVEPHGTGTFEIVDSTTEQVIGTIAYVACVLMPQAVAPATTPAQLRCLR